MGHYISLHSGGYYEGDRASHLDIEVPQRPSVLHVWDGAAWVLDAQAQRDALQAQIDALEQKAIENRKWREYSIIQMGRLLPLTVQRKYLHSMRRPHSLMPTL